MSTLVIVASLQLVLLTVTLDLSCLQIAFCHLILFSCQGGGARANPSLRRVKAKNVCKQQLSYQFCNVAKRAVLYSFI